MSTSDGLLSKEWIEGERDGEALGDCLGGSWPARENGDGILNQLHHRQTEPERGKWDGGEGVVRLQSLYSAGVYQYKVVIARFLSHVCSLLSLLLASRPWRARQKSSRQLYVQLSCSLVWPRKLTSSLSSNAGERRLQGWQLRPGPRELLDCHPT